MVLLAAAAALAVVAATSGCGRGPAAARPAVDVVATAVAVDAGGTGLEVDEVRMSGGTPLHLEARVRCVDRDGCSSEVVLVLDLASPTGTLSVPLRGTVVLEPGATTTLRRQVRSAPSVTGVAGGRLSAAGRPAAAGAELEIYE